MSRLAKAAAAAAATLTLTVIPAARSSAAVPNPDPAACVASGDHWGQLNPSGPSMWFELVGEHFAMARNYRYWHIVDNPLDNQYIGGFAVTCDLSNAPVGFADLTRTTDTPLPQQACGNTDFPTETQLSGGGFIISDYHLVGDRTSWIPGTPPYPRYTSKYVYWAVDETISNPPLPDAIAASSDSARCPANAAG